MGSPQDTGINQLMSSAERDFAQRNHDAASNTCRRILEASPDHPRALRILASIGFHAGRLNEATELLERAIRRSPQEPDLYNDYGAILLVENRIPDAIAAFEKSVELAPDHVEARVNLGNALHRRGRMVDAESQYRDALSRQPLHVRGLASLGNLVRITGRAEEAIEHFQTAVGQAPQAAHIHNFLGEAYRDIGQFDQAIDCFQEAVRLQPDMAQARFNLGGAAQARRDFATAIHHLGKINSPIARTMILECLLCQEEYDAFFAKLADDIRIEPRNLHTASLSAYASQQLNRPDIHPFCPDPMNFIRVVENAGGIPQIDRFLASIIDAVESIETVYEPKGISTRKGYQTAPTLFEASGGPLAQLREIIESEAVAYRGAFGSSNAALIRDWPDKIKLNGWFVRLLPGGHQGVHNHPVGWLSGVIYLRLPDDVSPPEGSIEFTLRNSGYPDISGQHPVRVHDPKPGDLVFFPSSLFHRTIPFSGDGDRLCIAFDVVAADES